MKFQNVLRAGVAVICMASGAAYAQFGGSIGVGGQRDDGWGFGTDVMMPFFTDGLSHMMYGMAGANYRKNDPEFSLGLGYRALPGYGEMMVGGYISAETWRADKNNWFYGATAGVELVVGPVSVGVNGYAPLGKSRQSIKGTEYSSQPVLVDRTPGSCNPGPARVCDLVIEDYGKRHAVNNWGGDVHVAYRLPFLEDIDIEIAGGAHLFKRRNERDIRGFSGGVDFLIPFGENVLMQANVKLRHETKGGRGTDALFGFGISYQFGGAGEGTTSYLRRKLMQTPERMNPGNRMQEQASVLVGREGIINADNPANVAISQVRFINRDTMNPGTVLNTAPQHSVVVYDGSKGVIDVNATQNVGASNVQVIGGGTVMNLRGATSGRSFTFTMDGSRPTINQTNMANNVFVVDGRTDVVFRNLDVRGGNNSFIFMNAAHRARLSNLTSTNADGSSYAFVGSTNARLDDIRSVNANNTGLAFTDGSHGGQASNVYVEAANLRGVLVFNSDNAVLNNIQVYGQNAAMVRVTDFGIRLTNAKNISLTNADVRYTTDAIIIENGSTDTKLTGITVFDAGGRGIFVSASNGGMFKDITVNTTGLRGFEVTNSDSIKLEDVRVNNTGQGAMAMLRDGITFNNSKNAELKNVSVSLTGGDGMAVFGHGIMFANGSTGAKIEGAIIQAVKGDGLVFNASGSATVKNITVVNAGLVGIEIFASDTVRVENALIDQTAAMATSRAVLVLGSNSVTLDELDLRGRMQLGVVLLDAVNTTIKNTKTSGFLTGYTLLGMTTTINLASTGNTSTNDMATCDGVNDIAMGSGPLVVTRITGMMTVNVNCR
ncbi:MAG: right-handed parallel beta-helix repeat-containing protein [Alphaproteobacteria bacterium]|nr:right-handed parallel beta-helix repeat-containing protein [Alphaproteobacteria bacterium]